MFFKKTIEQYFVQKFVAKLLNVKREDVTFSSLNGKIVVRFKSIREVNQHTQQVFDRPVFIDLDHESLGTLVKKVLHTLALKNRFDQGLEQDEGKNPMTQDELMGVIDRDCAYDSQREFEQFAAAYNTNNDDKS